MKINSIQQFLALPDPTSEEALKALQDFCFNATPELAYEQRRELGAIDALTHSDPLSNNAAYLEGFYSVVGLNN